MASSDQSLWIGNLDPSLPAGSEKLSDGDDAIRHTKLVTRDTFPQMVGAVQMNDTKLNSINDNVQSDAAQVIIDIATNASPTMIVNVNELNLNGKKLNNINGVPDTDADVPNKGYNDARYYTQTEIDDTNDGQDYVTGVRHSQAWPVGCVFFSATLTTPAQIANATGIGTWVRIGEGRFVVGTGTAGTVGNNRSYLARQDSWGRAVITLTTNEIPTHNHRIMGTWAGGRVTWDSDAVVQQSFSNVAVDLDNGTTYDVGGGAPHENSPPAYGLYMFERTS